MSPRSEASSCRSAAASADSLEPTPARRGPSRCERVRPGLIVMDVQASQRRARRRGRGWPPPRPAGPARCGPTTPSNVWRQPSGARAPGPDHLEAERDVRRGPRRQLGADAAERLELRQAGRAGADVRFRGRRATGVAPGSKSSYSRLTSASPPGQRRRCNFEECSCRFSQGPHQAVLPCRPRGAGDGSVARHALRFAGAPAARPSGPRGIRCPAGPARAAGP